MGPFFKDIPSILILLSQVDHGVSTPEWPLFVWSTSLQPHEGEHEVTRLYHHETWTVDNEIQTQVESIAERNWLMLQLGQRPDVYMAAWYTDKAKICTCISLGTRTHGLHQTRCIWTLFASMMLQFFSCDIGARDQEGLPLSTTIFTTLNQDTFTIITSRLLPTKKTSSTTRSFTHNLQLSRRIWLSTFTTIIDTMLIHLPSLTIGPINYNFQFLLISPCCRLLPQRGLVFFPGSSLRAMACLEPRCLLWWTSHAHAPQLIDDLIHHLFVFDHLERAMDMLWTSHLDRHWMLTRYPNQPPWRRQAHYLLTDPSLQNKHFNMP